MFGDQETFAGIHVDTLPLLYGDNLESTQALYFYDLIRIDPFGYHRDKISQKRSTSPLSLPVRSDNKPAKSCIFSRLFMISQFL